MKGTDLNIGDRVRHVTVLEGTVVRRSMGQGLIDGRPGRISLLRLDLGDGKIRSVLEDSDGYTLLERPLPPEPAKGSVVRLDGIVWVRDDVIPHRPWRTTNSETRKWADLARCPLEILHEEPA